jgi:hypothetical protein
MNPFELQVELSRQWFALAGGLASTALTVWTSKLAGGGACADRLRPTRPASGDATSAATAASASNPSLLFFNPVMALAPWAPWVYPAQAFNPWAALVGPHNRDVDIADHMTANYRSAGGHAVATIIAPRHTETRQRS